MTTLFRIVLCSMALGAAAAAASDPVETPVRVGTHAGYGRVVFDMPPGAGFDVTTENNRVLVMFTGAGQIREPSSVPRNVRAIRAGFDTATLELTPGARVRSSRLGERLVIDVIDAGGGHVTAPVRSAMQKRPTATPPKENAATGVKPVLAPEPAPAIVAAPPVAPPSSMPQQIAPSPVPEVHAGPEPGEGHRASPGLEPASVVPVHMTDLAEPAARLVAQAAPAQVAPPAHVVKARPSSPPSPLLPSFDVGADLDVGAAAFRREGRAVIVFDRRLPVQKVPLGVSWVEGTMTTVVHLPIPAEAALVVTRKASGWSIAVGAASGPGLSAVATDTGIGVVLPRPGRAVTVLDPVGGGTLLVGTSLAEGADAFVAEERRTPDYNLLPSWLGIVVEPSADRVDLRARAGGFAVLGAPPPATAPLLAQTRRFDLREEPVSEMLNRMRAQLASAAAAPARARSRDRLAAVQSMLALGLGAEAQSLVQVVAAEDPQAAADAQTQGLGAIAAILAGRPGEADGLDDARLDGSDEIMMWRGLRDRRIGRSSPASHRLGEFTPLVASYPEPLRRLVWPGVAEAAVEAGVKLPAERLPPFVQALALERDGKLDLALAAYDAVVAGRDRLAQVRAAARAAELRLSAGRIKPLEAAAIMDRQSFAWRGDGREAGFRVRAAELQAASGQWRPALDTLRALETAFPDQKADIQARKAGVMSMMLSVAGSELAALDVVLLATEYADAVPEGPAGVALARLLASKLTMLDLPARAIPILQGLMRAAPAGEARAEFGLRLAQLLMDGGDDAGAATAMDASAFPAVPPGLREARGLVQAKLKAAGGEPAAAAAILLEIGTERADDLRATLLVKAGDWRGASRALTDLASKRVPPEGALSEPAQDVLIRQASAAAQIPDPVMLRELARSAGRLEGARADLFKALTASPVDRAADLPRASRELAALRELPHRLQTIGSR